MKLTENEIRYENAALADENKRLSAEIDRLRALILDGCTVFNHYDLPEHAFHYRRALERKP